MRARVCFQTSSENKKMSSTNTCMSIASTATRTSVSFSGHGCPFELLSFLATLLYPYLTGDFTCGSHTSCDFQPSPLALAWIFFFEHSGHGCSSFISSLNSTQGIWYPNSPRNARKNTWLYRYANLKRYRRMLAERKQREYKMFCSFPTSPCRFSFLSTCACAASRRVASRSLHRIYMTCRPTT